MARKGILPASPQGKETDRPLSSGNPNIRRFREAFDELHAAAIQNIETDKIGSGAAEFTSRDNLLNGIEPLVTSIREAGQQIPILLRPAPDGSDHCIDGSGRG
jgi:hypothetical protein